MASLVVEPDRGLFKRRDLGGDEMPALNFLARGAESEGFLVEPGVTQGQEIFFDHLIVIHYCVGRLMKSLPPLSTPWVT